MNTQISSRNPHQLLPGVDAVSIFIRQQRKLKLSVVKSFVHSQMASKWQRTIFKTKQAGLTMEPSYNPHLKGSELLSKGGNKPFWSGGAAGPVQSSSTPVWQFGTRPALHTCLKFKFLFIFTSHRNLGKSSNFSMPQFAHL